MKKYNTYSVLENEPVSPKLETPPELPELTKYESNLKSDIKYKNFKKFNKPAYNQFYRDPRAVASSRENYKSEINKMSRTVEDKNTKNEQYLNGRQTNSIRNESRAVTPTAKTNNDKNGIELQTRDLTPPNNTKIDEINRRGEAPVIKYDENTDTAPNDNIKTTTATKPDLVNNVDPQQDNIKNNYNPQEYENFNKKPINKSFKTTKNLQSVYKSILYDFTKDTSRKISRITQGRNIKNMLPIRQSFGIICLRRTTRPEILLVQKRNTYSYNIFIHMAFNYTDDAEVIKLLCDMTHEEKIDIASLNFNQMWYRIWFNSSHTHKFYTCKDLFNEVFCKDDGARLYRLLRGSWTGNRIWEFPKGHMDINDVTPLVCAIREFGEETGIDKNAYQVLPNKYIDHEYISNGTIYQSRYFIAIIKKNTTQPNIGLHNMCEISDIKWLNYDNIKIIDNDRDLLRIAKKAFNFYGKL